MVAFIQKDLQVLDYLHQNVIMYSLLTSLQIHKFGKRHQEIIKSAPPCRVNHTWAISDRGCLTCS